MSLLNKKHRGSVILSAILILVIICIAYLYNYYRADTDAIDAYALELTVDKQILEDNTIVYIPEAAEAGFIFYPGGKVEYTAYEPLMKTLASEGILCMLVEMPFHLAVFDINAADGLQNHFPEIDEWYIGGHSLGGSMAASYLSENTDAFEGLVLLGAYSTADFSTDDMDVLSIYGSADLVLNKGNYEENKVNLPDNFTEVVIEGGCHAYFGMYGAQNGDGVPSITNEDQIRITVEHIVAFIENGQ